MVIETRLSGAESVLLLTPSGCCDDQRVFGPRHLPNAAADVKPVQLGQADVQYNQVGPECFCLFNAIQTIMSNTGKVR